ncbi:MAG: biotin/lipoyl-binding protein [Thermoproteales archaeon]|nr:biotin/lipoyl-binding protein [Thermoproteales archaeon]
MSSKKFRVTIDGEVYEIEVELTDVDSELDLLKKLFTKSKIREVEKRELTRQYSDRFITAPMTGKILTLNAKYGSEVKEDTVIAVLESMKTQVEITAGKSGRVKRILVAEGDVVKQGQAILELE